MSFVVKKLPLAEQDALEAAIWYEERQPGLGEQFLSEIDRTVRALSAAACFIESGLRMCAGRRSIVSSSMGSTTQFEEKRFGSSRSFMGGVTRAGWKSGGNDSDKFVCARRAL